MVMKGSVKHLYSAMEKFMAICELYTVHVQSLS